MFFSFLPNIDQSAKTSETEPLHWDPHLVELLYSESTESCRMFKSHTRRAPDTRNTDKVKEDGQSDPSYTPGSAGGKHTLKSDDESHMPATLQDSARMPRGCRRCKGVEVGFTMMKSLDLSNAIWYRNASPRFIIRKEELRADGERSTRNNPSSASRFSHLYPFTDSSRFHFITVRRKAKVWDRRHSERGCRKIRPDLIAKDSFQSINSSTSHPRYFRIPYSIQQRTFGLPPRRQKQASGILARNNSGI